MAAVANTFTTFTDNKQRNRETLSNLISNIDRAGTPLVSLIGTETIDGTHPEWNTDSYATPSVTNSRVQADTYSFSALSPTSRVGTYTQIMMKEGLVGETEQKVAKAGDKDELKRQKLKRGVELKTDIEVTCLLNQSSLAGDGTTPSLTGGLPSWISNTASLGATGAALGFNSATGLTRAGTNGTQRAFTKTILDDNMQAVSVAGGNPKVLLLSPQLKRAFSTFMSDSNVALNRKDVKGKDQLTIIGAAEEYVGDFGTVSTLIEYQTARVDAAAGNSNLTRRAYLIDPEQITRGVLRPIAEDKDVAKTSDAIPFVLKTEWALIVKNPNAHGCIADLFGKTASS